jgi:sugar phosphate isomerase/epimerase
MTFAYSTNAFVKFSLLESLERIARLGFNGVEIMADRPHLYPPDFDAAERAAVQEALTRHRLKVTNLNSFTLFAVGDTYLPSWIEAAPERRQIRVDHTLACLRMAKQLGCTNISVPPGGPLENGLTRPEAIKRFHQGLAQVAPEAENLGVKILIEPEPDLLIERTGEFLPFIREVRSPAVGLNFDIGHFFCAGEDPAVAFETLFEWVGHVHIEDIGADRTHRHLIAGHGAIDFTSVFNVMKRLDYRGDISLELYPYVDRPEEAGRQSRQVLQPLMEAAGLTVG